MQVHVHVHLASLIGIALVILPSCLFMLCVDLCRYGEDEW